MSNGVVCLLPGTAILLGGNLDVAQETWSTNASVVANMFAGYGCSSLLYTVPASTYRDLINILLVFALELHGQTSFIGKLEKPFATDLSYLHRSTFK